MFEDIVVDATKGCRCHHMTVVVGPTSEYLVERLYQCRHRRADVFTDQCSHFLLQGEDSLFGWRDVQHPAMLAEGLPEERNPSGILLTKVLFGERLRPRPARKPSTTGLTASSKKVLDFPVMMKSSA